MSLFLAVENVHEILFGTPKGKDHMGKLIKWMFREVNFEDVAGLTWLKTFHSIGLL